MERARNSLGGQPGDPSAATPTFADLIGHVNKVLRNAKNGDSDAGGTATGKGDGTLRGVTDAIREVIDLEYQDVLEEYYRSLADPQWRRK